jgi:hypothetical protein
MRTGAHRQLRRILGRQHVAFRPTGKLLLTKPEGVAAAAVAAVDIDDAGVRRKSGTSPSRR